VTPKLQAWLIFLALVLDIAGALIVAWGAFFMTPEQAIWLGAPRWGGTDAEMLQLPQVQSILAEARATRIGMLVVAAGFALQAVATWPGLASLRRSSRAPR
jgi:hypothetical protein